MGITAGERVAGCMVTRVNWMIQSPSTGYDEFSGQMLLTTLAMGRGEIGRLGDWETRRLGDWETRYAIVPISLIPQSPNHPIT